VNYGGLGPSQSPPDALNRPEGGTGVRLSASAPPEPPYLRFFLAFFFAAGFGFFGAAFFGATALP
jgi:hypothetical protein